MKKALTIIFAFTSFLAFSQCVGPDVQVTVQTNIRSTQFASGVVGVSSESPVSTASKATGAPDVYPSAGDAAGAWSPATADGQREFIELSFDSAQFVDWIRIYETFNPGAVDSVYLRDFATGDWNLVYSGEAKVSAKASRIFSIYIDQTPFKADAIRIALNSPAVPGFNQIDAVSITGNAAISSSGNLEICAETDVVLTATGATSYQWNNGSTDSIISAFLTTTTEFIVTGTTNGCQDTDTILVTVNPLPPINVSSTSTGICPGDSVTFTYNGTHEFVWRPANSDSIHTVYPAGSTEESIVVISEKQCLNFRNFHIHVEAPVVYVTSDVDSACAGSSFTLTADGSAPLTWYPGGITSNSITTSSDSTITYTIVVEDTEGCKDSVSHTVTIIPSPDVSISADANIVCQGSSVTLSATGAGSFVWSTGETTAQITVAPQADSAFTVTGTGAGGCTDTDTHTVTIIPSPDVSISADATVVCQGSNVTLSATGANSFVWSTGETTAQITVAPQADSVFTVTGTGAGGCTDTDTHTVSISPLPDVSVSADATLICQGSNVTLSATGAGSFVWSTGETTSQIIVAPQADSVFSVTGTNSDGCTDTAYVKINVDVCTEIDDLAGKYSISPNPSAGVVFIRSEINSGFKYEILDLRGATVSCGEAEFGSTGIDIRELPQGVYYFRIMSQGQVVTQKLLRQ